MDDTLAATDISGPEASGSLVIGVDVGGTNTDSVLLDLSKYGSDAVLASHKAVTSSNVALGVQETLQALLAGAAAAPASDASGRFDSTSSSTSTKVAAVAIGTTHFLNAIIERDVSRVEKVAVLRLAAHNFSTGTPPFADWPRPLESIIHGYSAIIPGGCNIDGTLIAHLDGDEVRRQATAIRAAGIKNVVVVGIGSPMDERHHQEKRARDIIIDELGDETNVVCSADIAGSGLLARENASILNAAILSFARRTIRAFIGAMARVGLSCPLYLTSNAGHLLPFSEAMTAPIRIFSSGATNSIRGAAFLAGTEAIGRTGSVVVDIGGTTTDVGYLLGNGYPRLTKSYSDLAGVKVNLEMASVESVGLGGGSIVRVDQAPVSVGPQSVGHDLMTRALCFGGDQTTATDIAVAGGARIEAKGLRGVNLSQAVVASAQARIKKMIETTIDRAKSSPDPCTVILVGGGSILCPRELRGVRKVLVPPHAAVANAIGAATANVHGAAETIIHGADVATGIAAVKKKAVGNAVAKGGDARGPVTVLHEEVAGVPYVEGQTVIKIEVALPAGHARVYAEMLRTPSENYEKAVDEEVSGSAGARTGNTGDARQVDAEAPVVNPDCYRPEITSDGHWKVSQTDIHFLSIGCYILGCGGGGSTYTHHLELRQLLHEGHDVRIVETTSLGDDDVLVPVAGVGTPAVGIERPGGDGVYHAMQEMEKLMGGHFSRLLATEIGGANGVGMLLWGSSKYYSIPTVDGDLMGRAYPNFEMVSQYVMGNSIDELLPVTLCSGTGHNVVIPRGQPDAATASAAIRDKLIAMGSAGGAAGNPITGAEMKHFGIPNTFSLAWRLGRAVVAAKSRPRAWSFADVARSIIAECGGPGCCRVVFRGKMRGVESRITTTAHSIGQVTIEKVDEEDDDDGLYDGEDAGSITEVKVPFMNENLSVIGRKADGTEKVLAMVPDLIMILDIYTGENVGVQDYRYGLKVAVMAMAPHPVWTTKRGLEVGGPKAFGLPYEYVPTLEYSKPRSVIDEFQSPCATAAP
ncbi:hydantoinase [Pyricularia oryzae]|nr:hydantoinase [Pyricularia oryzae]